MATNTLIDSLQAQPPAAVPQPTQFNALQNLPVFEGRSDVDRNSALLQAGLAMLQPNATGDLLQGFTGGVQAGLSDLDRTAAAAQAADQQTFQNAITQQQADAGTTSAEAAGTKAGAAVTTAETGQARVGVAEDRLAFDEKKFDDQWDLRQAEVTKLLAEAGFKDRMPQAKGTGTGGRTASDLTMELLKIYALDEYTKNPEAWSNAEGEPDFVRLIPEVMPRLSLGRGLGANPSLAVLASLPGQGEQMNQGLRDVAGGSAAGPATPAPSTEANVLLKTQALSFEKADWDRLMALPETNPEKIRYTQLLSTDPEALTAFRAAMTQ